MCTSYLSKILFRDRLPANLTSQATLTFPRGSQEFRFSSLIRLYKIDGYGDLINQGLLALDTSATEWATQATSEPKSGDTFIAPKGRRVTQL
jgi:hypothetical protein